MINVTCLQRRLFDFLVIYELFQCFNKPSLSCLKRGWNIVFLILFTPPSGWLYRNAIGGKNNKKIMFLVIGIMQMFNRLLSMETRGWRWEFQENKEGRDPTTFFAWWHSSFNQTPSRRHKKHWKLKNIFSLYKIQLLESFHSVQTFFYYFVFSADCELLCVFKEDFDQVLKEPMETKHEDIKSAVRRFEYFKNFTDEKVGKVNLCE